MHDSMNAWAHCTSGWEIRCGDALFLVLSTYVSLGKGFLLCLKPMEFSATDLHEMVVLDGSRGMTTSNTYKLRVWRCLNAKQAPNKSLIKVRDKEEAFCFRRYSYTP